MGTTINTTPTIDRLWKGFCDASFGGEDSLPPVQRMDLKRTFVAGMKSAMDLALEPEGDTDVGLEAIVRQLAVEFLLFVEMVKRGQA